MIYESGVMGSTEYVRSTEYGNYGELSPASKIAN